MSRHLLTLGSLVLLPLALCSRQDRDLRQQTARPTYKSPLGLAVDERGQRAYVALRTAGTVAVVDLEAGKVLHEIPVDRGPYDLVLAGGKVFITCEADDSLVILDAARLAVLKKLRVGQAPRGVAVTPDGKRAFVVCHDEQALRWIDLKTGQTQTLPLPGWPERVVFHRQWKQLHLLALSSRPGEAMVSLIDPNVPQRVPITNHLHDVTNVRGLASVGTLTGTDEVALETFALVAHQRPRTRLPTTQVAQGWVFTNAVSTIQAETNQGEVGKVLDDPVRSYSDPSDVVLSPDHRYAFITSAGADMVLATRRDKVVVWVGLERTLYHWGYGTEDLAASRLYIGAHLPTQANPRRLALSGDGSRLVVSNYLGDSLTVIDAKQLRILRHIPLGGPPPNAPRRGEILFNSARMTFQRQFTCASCHPDGGTDGLNWDLTRDGVGNFMNTRSLLGVKDTAPYGWHSSSPTLADRVTGTLRTLHRHEPTAAEVSDLTAYLESLPPPRPLPQRPEDRPALARGRPLFEGKAGCTACHRGDTFQDGKTHDLGTRSPQDTQDRFDTPSLRGVARTAPYLHDGRAATLEEVFTKHNASQRHGAAHRLTADELQDLVTYLKSL
jgi:YVTN family beta-propeller protein